jgi:hypothetical protein
MTPAITTATVVATAYGLLPVGVAEHYDMQG